MTEEMEICIIRDHSRKAEVIPNQRVELSQSNFKAQTNKEEPSSTWKKVVDIIKEAILRLDLHQDITTMILIGREKEKESVIEIGTINHRWLCQITKSIMIRGWLRVDHKLHRLALWINTTNKNPPTTKNKREQTQSLEATKGTVITRCRCSSKSTRWEDRSCWIRVLSFSIICSRVMGIRVRSSRRICISLTCSSLGRKEWRTCRIIEVHWEIQLICRIFWTTLPTHIIRSTRALLVHLWIRTTMTLPMLNKTDTTRARSTPPRTHKHHKLTTTEPRTSFPTPNQTL